MSKSPVVHVVRPIVALPEVQLVQEVSWTNLRDSTTPSPGAGPLHVEQDLRSRLC